MRRFSSLVVPILLLAVLLIPSVVLAADIAASEQFAASRQLQTLSPAVETLKDAGKAAVATVTKEIDGQTYMSLWLEGKVNEADLKALGVIIESRFPNGVMTAQVPLAMYRNVSSLPGMERITAVHMVHPCLDYSTPSTEAKPNFWTSSPPNFSGQTGAGVVVGDVNNGIDYKHGDFKNPDNTSRILFIWDQIDGTTPHPSGYSYGREWTNANINANLPTVRDGIDGHGSHCMGIAAGDGSATGNGQPGDVFIGMAPRADMIIVVTDMTDAHIANGVQYIFDKAASLGKNAVVSLSLGSGWGAHLGNETFDTTISSLAGAGKIIVASAGNDGGQAIHALQMVPIGGGNQTVTFTIPSYTTNSGTSNDFLQFDCYYDATASMRVAVTSPRGTSNVAAVSKGATGGTATTATDGMVYVENGVTPSPSGLTNIFIQIYDWSNSRPPRAGGWTLTLTPVSGTNPQLDLWLPSFQLGSAYVQPYFTSDVDEHDTIGSPASAPNVIGVGAITDKNRWLSINGNPYVFTDTTAVGSLTHWSSVGPLRDGTHKPELVTFGGGVMSTLSSAVTRSAANRIYIHPDDQHQIMSGTSMSAPHVAGGVALLLADTPGMTVAQVKARLAADALVDGQTGSVWNYQYGNGKLRMLRPDTTPPSVTVNSPNGGENWGFASSHNITWTATDNVAVTSIDIAYSTNNGASYTPIATGEANDGAYPWTVPSIATTQALVKVTAYDAATNTAFDVSNAVFTISDQTAPAVTVNSPNGGENWAFASSHNITWTATDNVAVTSIDIAYSTNNGASYTPIATGEANDGVYPWTVPSIATTQALVKVTAYDAATNTAFDVSNAVFTISDQTAPAVTVNAPNGGEVWEVGSAQNITWTATDNVGVTTVDIAYSTDNGGSYTPVATGEANDGVYPWTVPNTPSALALVKVTAHDAASNTAFDVSNATFTICVYTITASAGTGGTITPNGAVQVLPGADQGFTIEADPCYDILDVVVDSAPQGPLAAYTFYNVHANHTIAASFVLKTYTIAASAGPGGTIDPVGDIDVDCGADQGFTIEADPCYDILNVVVDGVPQGPLAAYTFLDVQADHTIVASFVLKSFTIAASAGAGGTIDPVGDIDVDCGADQGFTIEADPCYDILNVVVDGVPQGPLAAYTFLDVQADHTIAASFVLKTYTIAASAGPGGTIDPVGDIDVNCGADQGFTIEADPCYDILDVVVDGVPQGPLAAYTFLDVQADHTIAASFVLKSFTIAASAGAGGTIDPAGDIDVNCGADQGFTIEADPCYDILDVVVDGVPQGPLAAYTFLDVQADHTIAASFVLKTYTIAASAGPGGTIDPVGDIDVDCGADQGFTIAAAPCYDILDVVVDGVPQGPLPAYTFLDVQADHTIAASFVLKTYTIAASAGPGGTIDPVGDIDVDCGADQGFTIAAAPCYDILDVVVDGVPQGPLPAYTFLDVQADHTIAASFVLKSYTIAASAGAGGTIDPAGDIDVDCGADQGFTIAAAPCYDILDVVVDGVPQGPLPAYTFLDVQADHTIVASFVLKSFTIAASAGAGGTIDPVGDIDVDCGADQGFTIEADPCYDILNVVVDGVPQGPLAAYTFLDVQADHTIVASFVLKSFTIAASAGPGGTIDPVGDIDVDCGADQGFTIAAAPCYDILDVVVDGVPQGPLPAYTFLDVQADHTIAASFVLKTYTIAASAGAGGTIDPVGDIDVDCGADQGFTIEAAPCYDILDVVVDGVPQGPLPAYTFLDVQADHTIAASFVLKTYTIAASAGAGGTIDPAGDIDVDCGADQGFTIAAAPCYDILDVVVDGVPQGPLPAYTFLDVQADHTIAASFVLKTYTIAASAGPGGTIDPVGDIDVDCGADQGFTIAAAPCYDILDVVVDGVPQGPLPAYTFLDVQADHTIAASFVLKTYTIAASAGAGGTIDPAGDIDVDCGADQGFTIAAAPCYDILDVVVDGVPQGPLPAYTFLDVQADHTIAASFVLKTFTIAASAGPGGTIDPVGDIDVDCGADQGFTIEADPCYDILDVVVDGVPQGPLAAYTFLDVQADHTIAASFVLKTYTIAASAGPGGTIDPVGDIDVNCGADQGFTIEADPCYDILDVVVDGVPQGPLAAYTFLDVQADHTIAASFVLKSFTIAASAGAGGTIDPAGDIDVDCGADQGFTIEAAPCYDILDVVVDGVPQGPLAAYTFLDVQADHTIAASFVLKTYTIAASAGPGGTIDPVGDIDVDCGADQGFTIEADPCYDILDVVVDGVPQGPLAAYTFLDVQADHTIAASFVLKTFTIAASAGPGGTIDPVGDIEVDCGADQGFTIEADPCYDILDVVVDGVPQGPLPAYTFLDVQADHTIVASFVLRTYTLATSVVGGGSLLVVPLKANYDCGESVQITPVADPGWQFDHWTGSATGSDNPLTVIMDADKSITGVFIDIAPPEVLLTAPNGGEVWNVGTTQTITWTATDNAAVTAIDLEYSTDGGATYPFVIDTGLANSGSYAWLVPNTPTLNARVRVTAHDAAAHTAADASDADFEIHNEQSAVAEALLGDHDVMGVYPNPAYAGNAHVLYRIPSTSAIDISIYTISGRMIRRLESGSSAAGIHDLAWDGRDDGGNSVAAGIYLVRFVSGAGVHVTKRFVLFR